MRANEPFIATWGHDRRGWWLADSGGHRRRVDSTAVIATLLLGFSVVGCATLEKVATVGNANRMREATRQVCADLAEADRLAGGVLDDAGVDAP